MSDAMLTATQNLVQAFNNNTRAYIYNSGQYTSQTYTGPGTFLIATGQSNQGSTSTATGYGSGSGVGGRAVSISIINEASGTIKLYNNVSTTSIPDSACLAVFKDPTLQVLPVGMQFVVGLVMVIEGQISANVTYSLG